ncbi:ATP-binding protein [Effusibacillus pohliae]|uniref:hypothetical protein n=1 Tax=Effusibacillus pohliae TaxID=232270 RepID=UPI00036AA171|nr:hypothetical protein [Effusibacillus pohliae]
MSRLTIRISPSNLQPDPEALLRHVDSRLAAGQSVTVDALLRSAKARAPFLKVARQHGAATKIVFSPSRIDRRLQIPTYAEAADQIEIRQDVQVDEAAAGFFRQHEQALVENPAGIFRQLEQDGRLLRWIPEYKGTIGLDQHSRYHTYSVFDHILHAVSFVAGTNLKMVWAVLLHDIGKGYPGIKQFLGVFVEPYASYAKKDRVVIENGERIRNGLDSGETYRVNGVDIPKKYIATDLMGHFYDHENVGAQLALRILPRIGYSPGFAHEVAALVQFHMSMPRELDTISAASLKKWYAKVGPYAAELMMVRLADDRGK